MNGLQKRRMELGLTQPQLSASLKLVDARIDVGMVSRFEQSVCLPTPLVMEKLEEVLRKSRFELYDFQDIDLVGPNPEKKAEEQNPQAQVHEKKDTRSQSSLRKCYRVPREFMAQIPKDILDICGYSSWQSWHDACLKRLLGEYAAKKKALKSKEAS